MSLPWARGRSSPACRRDSWPICGSRPPSCPLAVSVFILASSSAPIPLSIASDLDSRVLHSKSRVSVTFYLFKWHCPLWLVVGSTSRFESSGGSQREFVQADILDRC